MKLIGMLEMILVLALIAIVCALSKDYTWNPYSGSEL